MADINVSPGKTNDPSYVNNSQGTDRATLQPLAELPNLNTRYIKPDYATNYTAGSAIKGVGDLSEAALKLTDKVIQQKADDTLTDGINKIRDSFGVAAAADQSSGIAQAAGQAGSENPETLLSGVQANQPIAINRLGNKIDGLYEAYQQGGLSNSAYYAKMEAEVRRVKQQFPGYSNDIDTMVSTKLGVNPANALRASLQQDVASLAGKVQSMNDKRTAFEHQNAGVIVERYPNYFADKAAGKAPPFAEVEQTVAQHDAEVARLDLGQKRLAANQSKAGDMQNDAMDVAYQAASMIDRNITLKLTNGMGIKNLQDLKDYTDSVRAGTRPEPTPDELQMLTAIGSQFKQEADNKIQMFLNKPLSEGSTETVASRIRDGGKLQQIRDAAGSSVKTILDGITNKEHGIVASTVNYNIATNAMYDKRLVSNVPDAGTLGALRRQMGDQFLLNLQVSNSGVMTHVMQVLEAAGWQDVANGKPLLGTLENMSRDDPTGQSSRAHVKTATDMVIHQDKLADKTFGDKAFKSLYGDGNRTLIDGFNAQPSTQVGLFSDLLNPRVTKAVAKRSKEDQNQYEKTATDWFQSIFEQRAEYANGVAANLDGGGELNLKLNYNPKEAQFFYKGNSVVNFIPNKSLGELNQGIATMKEVWKMQGKDPTEQLYNMLPAIGVQPGTPIYKLLQEEFLKTHVDKSGAFPAVRVGGNRYAE